MKAEKKPQVPVAHDIVLTLSPAEAKALYYIAEDFYPAEDDDQSQYLVPGDTHRFDVILHRALRYLGAAREG